jgi:hypothetical protein
MNADSAKYVEKEREISVYGMFDVIVTGAGMSGVAAAIAAGRQGVKTLLVERSGVLGGVGTSSMMSSVTNLFFTNKNRQVVKGIAAEIIGKLEEKEAVPAEWRDFMVPQIPYDTETMQVTLFHMLREANVGILLHTLVTDVILSENETGGEKAIKGLVIENKAGRQALYSQVVVDCSGDADVARLAGVPYDYSGSDGATVMFEMGNVNLQQTYEYYRDHRNDFDTEADIAHPFADFESNWLERGIFHTPHNGGHKNTLLQEAIRQKKYFKEKGMGVKLDAFGLYGVRGTGKVLVNSNYYYIDPLNDIEQLSQAELEGRERCLELGKLLNEIMPGFENAFITRIAAEIGVRVTRVVQSHYRITDADFFSGREFADAVCYTPSMVKTSRGMMISDKMLGIPYRSLLPLGVDNLLIGSGKSISAERIVLRKSLRAQVNTMQIGEAAGTAAAVAVSEGSKVKSVDINKVRERLIRSSLD